MPKVTRRNPHREQCTNLTTKNGSLANLTTKNGSLAHLTTKIGSLALFGEKKEPTVEIFLKDPDVVRNSLIHFADDLIRYFLVKKCFGIGSNLNSPSIVKTLEPLVYLFDEDIHGSLLNIMNNFEKAIKVIFDGNKHKLGSSDELHGFMLNIETKFFSCYRHAPNEICPETFNTMMAYNFLIYLAITCRLAGMAYLWGVAEAPSMFAAEIATTIQNIQARLLDIGGWRAINDLCYNLTKYPDFVQNVAVHRCGSPPNYVA